LLGTRTPETQIDLQNGTTPHDEQRREHRGTGREAIAEPSEFAEKPQESKILSIVIVAWNCRSQIEECLRSIQRLDLKRFETIVVDNNSTDGTTEFLASIGEEPRERLGLTTIFQETNAGLSQASAVAVEKSSGEWLVACNPDIVFTEDFGKMLDFARSHDFPILVPQLISSNGNRQYCTREFTFTRLFFNLTRSGRLINRVLARNFFARESHYNYILFERPMLVDHPVASFLLIKRSSIRQLGGLFSLEFPVYFGDTDLFTRAAAQKVPIVFLPAIRMFHQMSYSRAVLPPEIVQFMFTNGMVRYADKWGKFPTMLKALLTIDAIVAPLTHARLPSKSDISRSAYALKGAFTP